MSWSLLVSGAAVVFSLASFFYFRSYVKKRTSGEAVLARIREEINLLLIRVDEITNRDITLLEDKENSLKGLLEETEKRLKVYTRELERSLRGEKSYRELGRAFSRTQSVDGEKPVEAPSPAAAGSGPVQTETPAPAAETKPEDAPKLAAAASIAGEIRRLVNAGLSPRLIASKLGISISEVELAAALMEKKPL